MRDDFPPHPVFKIPATADDPPQPPGAPGFGLVQPAEPVRTGRIVAAGAVGAVVLGVIFAVAAPKGFPGAPDTRPAVKAEAADYRPIAGRYAPPNRERILAAYREVAQVSAADGVGAVARASMDCFQKLARQADYGLMDYCLALDTFGAETYARVAGEAAPPSTYFGQGPVRRQHAVQSLTAGQTDANSRLLDTNRLIQEVALQPTDLTPPPPPPPPPPAVIAAAEPPPAPVAARAAAPGPISAKLLAPTPLAPMPAPAPGPNRVVQVAKVEAKPSLAAPPAPAVVKVFNKPAPAAEARPAPPARPTVVTVVAAKPAPPRSAPTRQMAQARLAAAAARPVKIAKAPPPLPQPSRTRLAKAAKAPPAPLRPTPLRPTPGIVLSRTEAKAARSLLQLRAPWARDAKSDVKAKAPPVVLAQRPAPPAPVAKSAPAARPAPVKIAKAEPIAPPPALEVRARPPVVADRSPAPEARAEPKPEPRAEPKAEVREAKHEEPAGCRGRTRGERMVCQEPALAAADKRLSAAFSQALDQAPNPRALVAEQNRWLARRDALAPDAGAVMTAYQDRIAELNHKGR